MISVLIRKTQRTDTRRSGEGHVEIGAEGEVMREKDKKLEETKDHPPLDTLEGAWPR